MAEPLSREKIEGIAPDQASLAAALKLLKPATWPLLAREAAQELVWGECQGSGAVPYRTVVSLASLGYKCTCPSRKFPCKHVLALLIMVCEKPDLLPEGTPPAWVHDWLSRRRPRSGSPQKPETPKPETAAGGGAGPVPSLAAALAGAPAEEAGPAGPKAAARAEAQRQKQRQAREAAILAGLDELDRWTADQLNLGLAGFAQRASQSTRALSARLVDAKAQGLATRLDQLAADVLRLPEDLRADFAMERLGALVLLAAAYRRQDRLSPALAAEVRRAVGWTLKRDELLAESGVPRFSAQWLIAATRSELQPDKLRRLETWLFNLTPEDGAPRFALLLDFVPLAIKTAQSPFSPGEALAAEVAFYPSPVLLRAVLAASGPSLPAAPWPPLPQGLETALAEYERALALCPWLQVWPLAAAGIELLPLDRKRLALVDASGTSLPLSTAQSEALICVQGVSPLSVTFLWDGRAATVLALDTPLGPWYGGNGL